MAVVTKIEPQVKRTGYYNIYLDDVYFCSLSDLQLSHWRLKRGQQLSEDDKTKLANDYHSQKTYNRAIYYLQYGPKTLWQMRTYLLDKGYESEHIDLAIDRLVQENYLNDTEYAKSWVADRSRNKPRSRRQLYSELLKKRIPKDIIESVLDDREPDAELQAIQKILYKKSKQARYQDHQKLTEYLLRQGFGYSRVKESLILFEESKE